MLPANIKQKLSRRYMIYGRTIPTEDLYIYQNLILKCKDGKTLSELRIKNSRSIFSLVKKGFLEKKGDVYKTAFPIVLGKDYCYMRKKSKIVAKCIIGRIKDDIRLLKNELAKLGYDRYTIMILFSVLMDDIAFSIFEKKGYTKQISTLIKENEGKETAPAYIWLSNLRKSICGTYFIKFQRGEIKYLWDLDNPIPFPFPFNENDLMALDHFASNNKIDIEELDKLKKYELIKNQKVSIPLLYKDTDDELFDLCNKIAKKIVTIFIRKGDVIGIDKKLKINDIQKTTCIVYHEVMTDILDILKREKIIKKEKVNPLIFLYDTKPKVN